MTASFEDRLQTARTLVGEMVALWSGSIDTGHPTVVSMLDQFWAATRDGNVLQADFTRSHPRFRPLDARTEPSLEQVAYLMAAAMGMASCPHLRTPSMQVVYALLGRRYLACAECVDTAPVPLSTDADRCDVCDRHQVADFWPFRIQCGPVLYIGDMCDACRSVLVERES